MRIIAGFLSVACLFVIASAQTPQRITKPLTQQDVLGLVHAGMGDESGGNRVKECGLAFVPTDGFLEELRNGGATEAFLEAVKGAGHPSDVLHAHKPLNRVALTALLQAQVAPQRITTLIGEGGIGFEPTDDDLKHFRSLGADDDLLSVIKSAKKILPSGSLSDKGHGASIKRVRMGGQIEAAKLIFHPNPEYPPLAKTARVQGTVRLGVIIGGDGMVQDIKVLSGHPLLIESTIRAVSEWQYQPTLMGGKPVEVVTEVDVNYTLSQ